MKEREIFEAALGIEDEQLIQAFLAEHCSENPDLKKRIASALGAHRKLGSFLEQPVADFTFTDELPGLESPGQIIGPYELKERMGTGGMGVVWAAVQKEPIRRKVAIKLIKPGMDSEQVLARFDAEREALSLMDHPNIANVLDAGTTSQGRPFFVMELIQGKPITEYCDSNKLPVSDRLRLFVQVCRAVQHAHQKGIIHRDIKPQNVLVTEKDGDPLPKVIDFGVAKALYRPLTDHSIYTAVFHAIGTMAYMSPEQAGLSSNDVDSRADVYGLGTLLYELLTGQTPFRKEELASAAFDKACQIIRDQEPCKPSATVGTMGDQASSVSDLRQTNPARLQRLIRGELDWIVLKALEKNRNRRYESASSLGDDIHRYLNGSPVSVSPPSTVYRLSRFVRRHRLAIGVGSLLAASLLIGLTISTNLALKNKRLLIAETATKEVLRAANRDLTKSRSALADVSYTRGIMSSYAEWANANPQRVAELLESTRRQCERENQQPGIEWHLLWQQLQRDHADTGGVTLGTTNPFTKVSFSRDSATLAIPMLRSGIRFVDTRTGNQEDVLLDDSDQGISAITATFSPVDDMLLVGVKTTERKGQLYQLDRDGGWSHLMDLEFEPWLIQFSPNGDLVSIDSARSGRRPPRSMVKMYRRSDWQLLWQQEPEIGPLAFIDNGRQIASIDNGKLTVRDAETGKVIESISGPPTPSEPHLTPDGLSLITPSETSVTTWTLNPIRRVSVMPASVGSYQMAISKTEPFIVAWQQDRRAVEIREWKTNRLIRRIVENVDAEHIAMAPNGHYLATIALTGRIKLWDIRRSHQPFTETHTSEWFYTLASSPKGDEVAMPFGPRGFKLWNTTNGRSRLIEAAHSDYVAGLDISPDGQWVTTGAFDGCVRIWNLKTLRLEKSLADDLAAVWAVKFSRMDSELPQWRTADRFMSGTSTRVASLQRSKILTGFATIPSIFSRMKTAS